MPLRFANSINQWWSFVNQLVYYRCENEGYNGLALGISW